MATFTSDTGLELDDTDPDDRKILDRQRAAARNAGSAGDDRAGATRGRPDLEAAYDEGAAGGEASPKAPAAAGKKPAAAGKKPAAAAPRKSSGTAGGGVGSLPTPTLRPPRGLTSKDAGGFALGLLVQALAVSYIRYGAAGPKGWLSAKFLNKPIQGKDLAAQNRKDANNGVDPSASGVGPNGEQPAEGHLDPNKPIM
jgi:hypothetical protein